MRSPHTGSAPAREGEQVDAARESGQQRGRTESPQPEEHVGSGGVVRRKEAPDRQYPADDPVFAATSP